MLRMSHPTLLSRQHHSLLALLSSLVLVLSLSGCGIVGDARVQFCARLRALDQTVGQLKDSKAISTVGQLREKVKAVRDGLSTAASLAPAGLGINFDGLIKSLDNLEKAAQGLPDTMPIQEALTKVGGAADDVQKQYAAVFDAVCAAK